MIKFLKIQWWLLLFKLGFSLDIDKRGQVARWITRNVKEEMTELEGK